MEKLKKILLAVFAVAMVAVLVIWMLNDNVQHIEDTNGPDDYTLQTITDENICKMDIGSRNVAMSEILLSDTVTCSSNCFTGVYKVYYENIITGWFEITVNHAQVNAGNFKMVICVDDEIVHEFKLNELSQTFTLENVSGTVSFRIAGESADFMFDYYIS